jgi:hypothetical protein
MVWGRPHGPPGSCARNELIVEEGGVLGEQRRVKVPYLQYLPTAWAPYFMAPQTPEQAMRTWRALELANVTERHTTIMRQVTKWLAAACVRVGPVGANRSKSKLHLTWAPSPGLFDRELTRWAVRRLSPFLTVAPPVVPPMLVGDRCGIQRARSVYQPVGTDAPNYGGNGDDAI